MGFDYITHYNIYVLCHNMDSKEVGRISVETGQEEFLFTVATLHLENGTGSPCTPVVVF